jgi:glycosyltransferase involved in cell wall biosynthesis
VKILLINYEYPPIGAGAANATKHLAEQFFKSGCEVFVLTSGFGDLLGRSVESGVVVIRCKAIRKFQAKSNLLEMLSFVVSGCWSICTGRIGKGFDAIIVFFSLPCGPLGLLLNRLFRTPYIVSLRGGDVPGLEGSVGGVHKLLSPIRRVVLKNALAVVANSEGLKAAALKADPVCDVQVIPNGVDPDYFAPDPSVKIDDGIMRFLFVGRFHAQKNLLFLLEQIRRLRETAGDNVFELTLVGDGPELPGLVEFIGKHGLKKIVRLEGWSGKVELRLHYQKADFLINPSLYEGLPNVVLEAMASGLPVIASNVAGNRELVMHNTGYLFDIGDAEGFHGVLNKALACRAQARDMGKEARREVVQRYSWAAVASDYIRLMNQYWNSESMKEKIAVSRRS